MEATSFEQSNAALSKPQDMTCDECNGLSVFQGNDMSGRPFVISCWKLTQEELEEFQRTGRIWLTVMGSTMPPVSLSALLPFVQSEEV